ncbi:Pkinase-domain-containing protein [Myriangium duriaei CBS 260.36]|uniref:non-specific serine/threonine protein kinase n=1 Tax=Myriangium duriaei CBS 260.36 TaxID=1168546 RepID=A0A9P4J932_9PEZI|nr:Pkinase-domain-containing protein [Myriangium duriaei CBS 260.36]
MATRYHQQATAHTRPSSRRQPLGPGDARANIHPQAYPSADKRASHRVSAHPKDLPQNRSLENNSSPQARSSPTHAQGKRISHIKSYEQQHNGKRDSEISNASSTGSGNGRKRTIGQWQLGRTIGRGGCSTVRLVRHVVTGQQGAVKIISRKMAEQVRAQSLANLAASQEASIADLAAAGKMMPPPPGLLREIAIMKLLDHPNIIKLYDVWENHNELYLVMEYVPGGELFHYVEECRGLDEKETIYIFRQIVAALLYCHRMHIHHRDLKPENILLDRDNAQIKLVDFGMAALQPEGKQLTTACGSPHYAAPEVIRSRPYDGAKADVWSCGVILYVMLTGTTPFNYDHERNLAVMYAAIQMADYYMPPELSHQAKDLLRKIFVTRPEKRISMSEIWDHPLLHKYDRDFGYDGDLAQKDRWVGPAATLDEWSVTREEDIDKEILRNMRTLWHSVPQSVLVKKLLSQQPNQEQVFYAALAKHKEEHLENYTGGGDGVAYSTSDYQHAKPENSAVAPQTKQTSQSSYSIMNNEHLRSSSIAERQSSEGSYDPYKSNRHSTAPRPSHIPRGAGHRRGNSGNAKGSAQLRVEMLKRANQQARNARVASQHRVSSAPAAHSRSASRASNTASSRQSLTSSVWPSSPPVVVHVKPNAAHKRNVSFQHIRKTSGAANVLTQSANASARHTETPELEEEVDERGHPRNVDDDQVNELLASPTPQGSKDAQARKSKMPSGVTPRSKARKSETPGAIIRTEVRKVSTELEKACEEAFFRSSYGSSQQTASSTTDKQEYYDTPPSSVSTYAGVTPRSPGGRPLPEVPSDTPNTFIARTLEETRKKLVARSAGEADAARINEVLASLEKMMPSEAERRSTSAPQPQSPAEMGFLPIITEEPLPDTLKVGKGEKSKVHRSFTAPDPAQITHNTGPDTIRMVDQSPASAAKGAAGTKRDSNIKEKPVLSRPKTSDGSSQADKLLQVPSPHDFLLRKKSYDSAIGLKPSVSEEAQPVAIPEAGTKKESSWFRRWKKTTPPASQAHSPPGTGVPAHVRELDDRQGSKQKPSMLKRDKQPPQPLDLSKADPPAGLQTGDSEFPMRRISEGETKGFSRWLNKLQKKDEIRAIEIKDTQPSPSIISPATQSTSPRQTSPTTAPVNAQSWFARFFRMNPAPRITPFQVPRSRARTEIYRLLREFQHHGLQDLCYYPQENAITARVEKNNALGIKPVSFRVELFVVLQNGRKNGLSLARWTQTRGAQSGFMEVVDAVQRALETKGLVVEDIQQRREMESILLS